jgi:hypothetical protein
MERAQFLGWLALLIHASPARSPLGGQCSLAVFSVCYADCDAIEEPPEKDEIRKI